MINRPLLIAGIVLGLAFTAVCGYQTDDTAESQGALDALGSRTWSAAGAVVESSACPVHGTWNFCCGSSYIFTRSPGVQVQVLDLQAFGSRTYCEVEVAPQPNGTWASGGATGTCTLSTPGHAQRSFVAGPDWLVTPAINQWSVRGSLIGDGATTPIGCSRVVSAGLR
jgi:hypothetical protein